MVAIEEQNKERRNVVLWKFLNTFSTDSDKFIAR